MANLKVIALYLPQYHRIAENDEWWGEGFTEWTAVKNAVPLFREHMQPREPLHDYYYDLSDKKTMQWQASLAKEHNIHGFCFYHYWFKDGRKILEKPAENLLRWTDIDIPFCFSWANEAWARTWSNIDCKNTWAEKFETSKDEIRKDAGVLLEQKYGEEAEWKDHFLYLLPFFKDPRYIKIDNKPVYIFYKADVISCLEKMICYWNEMALQYGLSGIYTIVSNCAINRWPSADARLIHEPRSTLVGEQLAINLNKKKLNGLSFYSYDNVWANILTRRYSKFEKTILCGFVDYDDTPRRGNGGRIVEGATPKKFYKYFKNLVDQSLDLGNELVFINAFNEWGEGMYLEPDKKYGYGYLKSIKRVIDETAFHQLTKHFHEIHSRFKRFLTGDKDYEEEMSGVIRQKEEEITKYRVYYNILHQWLRLKEEGKSLEHYFITNGYHEIAIYGMGTMGKHLIEELNNSKVIIKYAIDERADMYSSDIKLMTPNNQLEPVDAVIVSLTFDTHAIEKKLREKLDCPIIMLEDVLNEN